MTYFLHISLISLLCTLFSQVHVVHFLELYFGQFLVIRSNGIRELILFMFIALCYQYHASVHPPLYLNLFIDIVAN